MTHYLKVVKLFCWLSLSAMTSCFVAPSKDLPTISILSWFIATRNKDPAQNLVEKDNTCLITLVSQFLWMYYCTYYLFISPVIYIAFMVQVLFHKGFLHWICHDLLLCIWCACLLANTSLLLDCSVCPNNEAPNCTHDQVQICSIQPWEAGELLILIIMCACVIHNHF